jgi:NADPH-dependent 2,4-dienoyl-CoA reductase/sulfur reductase-like enzyme
MQRTELAIIGAGPAGMAAAGMARDCGLDVTLVDEQHAPGGQIYRQPPAEFQVADWLQGRSYRDGKALVRRVSEDPAIRRLMGTSVAGILQGAAAGAEGGFVLLVETGEGVRKLHADAVLVAPGCYDMPVIFPGWDLPGVMAAGGIQAIGSCSPARTRCSSSSPISSSRPVPTWPVFTSPRAGPVCSRR